MKRPARKSLRLKDYNYSEPGDYFITLCTQDRECLFGVIINDAMKLNTAGKMIQVLWSEIPLHYKNLQTDIYQVMPNHFHAILTIRATCDLSSQELPSLSLSSIVQRFKTLTTRRYVDGVKNNQFKPFNGRLWQRNYYEHIIRNDISYCEIADYIQSNPANWRKDSLYFIHD